MKKNKTYLYVICGIIALGISLYMRTLPYAEQTNTKIKKAVLGFTYTKMKADIRKHVDETYPEMSVAEKRQLTKTYLRNMARENRDEIRKFLHDSAKKIKSNIGEAARNTHLIAADSYHYLGLTKNIRDSGRISDRIKNGLYYNPLMLAPHGGWYMFDLHPYAGWFTHKILSLFRHGIALEQSVAYTSLFLTVLAFLIFSMFGFRENIHPVPFFTASFFFLLSPMFFQRSLLGWYDTDPYNVIFPLAAVFIIFHIIDTGHNFKKTLAMTICLSAVTGIYSLFWSGWVFMPASVIISFLLIIAADVTGKKKNEIQNNLSLLTVYVGLTLCTLIILKGVGGLANALQGTFGRISAFMSDSFRIWPDSFLTVGELKKPSLLKILVLAGGRVFSVASVLYMFFCVFKKKSLYKHLSLLSFAIIPLSFSMRAERFTILLTIPYSLGFMFLLDDAYRRLTRKDFPGKKTIAVTAGFILIISLPVFSAWQMASRKQPMIYNDTWDKAMNYIKNNTPEDAIINTWWSPGHFITSMAERRVTFDGATLEKPVGYWIARAFISRDEKEAAGILRMLNSSGNKAYDFLSEKGFSPFEAVDLINSLVRLSRIEAKRHLVNYIQEPKDIDSLLSFTHDTSIPPGYLLLYNDLVEKALALCFVGNWDFKKATDFKSLKKKNPELAAKFIKQQAGNNYIKFLWAIAGGPVFYEKESFEIRRENGLIHFSNGIWVDPETKECGLKDKKDFKGDVKSIVYVEDGNIKENILSRSSSRLSVVLIEKDGSYSSVMADRKLANSLLFKLYYLKGKGLSHFNLTFDEKARETETTILLYKINF